MRVRDLKSLFLVALFAPLAFFNASCGGAEAQKGFSQSPSLGDDDENESVVSTTGFYVKSKAGDWPVRNLMHKFYDRSMPCAVSPTASGADTRIDCLLNVQEGDLYLADTNMEINVPPGMCSYVVQRPFTFWNDSAGDWACSCKAKFGCSWHNDDELCD